MLPTYLAALALLANAAAMAIELEAPRTAITATEIYEAAGIGARLYDQAKYDEAYPHLLLAAQHGLKNAQAKLAYMHFNGLGTIERSSWLGIGWLGAAASGVSDSKIRKYYKAKWKQVPVEYRAKFAEVVDAFVAIYGAEAHGLKCRRERATGTTVKTVACRFADTRYGDILEDPYSTLEAPLEESPTTPDPDLFRGPGNF